jgi:hypothetical protein
MVSSDPFNTPASLKPTSRNQRNEQLRTLVLHDVPVNVGGVVVKQHIFVISYLPAGLILGRPWERSTRATYTNKDDGNLMVTIRSPDNMKEVQFIAAHADHERNRDTVRPKE